MRNVDTSFIVYHHPSIDKHLLLQSVQSYLEQSDQGIEILIISDSTEEIDEVLKDLGCIARDKIVILRNTKEEGPGRAWNRGIQRAEGQYIVFTWSGVVWEKRLLVQLQRQIHTKIGAVYAPVRYEEMGQQLRMVGEVAWQWNEFINSIGLGGMLVDRAKVSRANLFLEEIEWNRIVDWEWIRRFGEKFKIKGIFGGEVRVKINLKDIEWDDISEKILDEQIREGILKQSSDTLYRAAIITGFNEGAQVQLCLVNYFEEKQGIWGWRRFVESEVKLSELENYNLVCLVRSQSLEAIKIAQFCLDKEIEIVYILDDNWMCMTETYPQLRGKVGRQTVGYANFMLLLALVNEVWVYNELVREDVLCYSNNVRLFKPNVKSNQFQAESNLPKKDIRIGFAGSSLKIYHFEEAFRALEKVMEEDKRVSFYCKGISVPSSFLKFGSRVIQEEYNQNYKEYAKEVGQWKCDIMISPMVDTRYMNSKCPNKYLEITAAGAVGIYTNIPLYREYISEGKNGVLVENQEATWYREIKRLLENDQLREAMWSNAKIDIEKNYETKVVKELFFTQLEERLNQNLKKKDILKNVDTRWKKKEAIHKNCLVLTSTIYSPSLKLGLENSLEHLYHEGRINYLIYETANVVEEYLDWADVIIWVRNIEDNSNKILELIKRKGKIALYYTDDSLYDIPMGIRGRRAYIDNDPIKFIENMNGVITCSEWLAEGYNKKFGIKSFVVRPAIKPVITKGIEHEGVIVIGMSGNIDYGRKLEVLRPVFKKLKEKYKKSIRFEFLGPKVTFLEEIEGIYYRPLAYESYEILLARRKWDIGIAYQEESNFSAHKFYNKYLEYARFGIAGVYSDISLFNRVIKTGENGILVSNTCEAWGEALGALIENINLRKKISFIAQEEVLEQFNPKQGAMDIYEKLTEFL